MRNVKLGASAAVLGAATEGPADAAALVQMSVDRRSEAELGVTTHVEATGAGPTVKTKLGGIQGIDADGVHVFRGVPYAEKPKPFHAAEPKKPWNRTREFKEANGGCIGSRVGTHSLESEDCLKLTLWVPKGGVTGVPVIVFFHGGQNQHGYAQDDARQGDIVARQKDMPVIFIGMDFRLGIYGWMQGYNVTPNLGLRDQQLALKWVRDHISNFGGDPKKVTLEGQSEGAHNIIAHMVSPYSRGLFQRVILFSPPANLWSRKTNKVRTQFVIEQTGCTGHDQMTACLRQMKNTRVWDKDWNGVELTRTLGSPRWWAQYENLRAFERSHSLSDDMPSFLGWHPVVDGNIVPKEPRVLIRSGQWNQVPVLITISKNESIGLVPTDDLEAIEKAMVPLFPTGDLDTVSLKYMSSLAKQNIVYKDRLSLLHAMLTDKLWTCDARSLADDIVVGGSRAFVGMFWHSPKFDPPGSLVNNKCIRGATCHAAEMLYALPQGRGKGIPDTMAFKKEEKFATRYMKDIMKFVYGALHVWAPWNNFTQTMTFYDTNGPEYVSHHRAEQCKVLDTNVNEFVPGFFKQRATKKASEPAVLPSAMLFDSYMKHMFTSKTSKKHLR